MASRHSIKVEIHYRIEGTEAEITDTKIVDNRLNREPAEFPAPYIDRVRPDAMELRASDETGASLPVTTIKEGGITYLVLSAPDDADQFHIPAGATKEYTVRYRVPGYMQKSRGLWYCSNHYGHTVRYEGHQQMGRVGKTALYEIPLGRWWWLQQYNAAVAPQKATTTVGHGVMTIKYEFTISLAESEYNTVVISLSRPKWVLVLQGLALLMRVMLQF